VGGENSSSKAFGISFADRPKAKTQFRTIPDSLLQKISLPIWEWEWELIFFRKQDQDSHKCLPDITDEREVISGGT
jgi:hypothetical protein